MINGYSKGLYDGIGEDRPNDYFTDWLSWARTEGYVPRDVDATMLRAAFNAGCDLMNWDAGFVRRPKWVRQ